MVRSIKSCSSCGLRFVSHGAGKHKKSHACSRCSKGRTIRVDGRDFNKENRHETAPPLVDVAVDVDKRDSHGDFSNRTRLKDDSDSCGSEGGDDFHCTQIIELEDSIDGDGDEVEEPTQAHGVRGFEEHQISAEAPTIPMVRAETILFPNEQQGQAHLPKSNQKAAAATATAATAAAAAAAATSVKSTPVAAAAAARSVIATTPASSSGDICFICGADLSRLKRRIDHIKRCSKKYGITGRDVRPVTHENSAYELSPPSPAAAATAAGDAAGDAAAEMTHQKEPNAKSEPMEDKATTSWHGEAEKLLKLTKQDRCKIVPIANPPAISGTSTATSISTSISTATSTKKSASSWIASGYNAKSGKFAPPRTTRNLNNVLMAGSRRLEVDARVAFKRGEIENSKGGSNTKRSKYSNWNCPAYKKITGTDFVVDGFHYAKQ